MTEKNIFIVHLKNFLVEFTKSIKPIQHFIELPENLIPLDEKLFIYYSLQNRTYMK